MIFRWLIQIKNSELLVFRSRFSSILVHFRRFMSILLNSFQIILWSRSRVKKSKGSESIKFCAKVCAFHHKHVLSYELVIFSHTKNSFATTSYWYPDLILNFLKGKSKDHRLFSTNMKKSFLRNIFRASETFSETKQHYYSTLGTSLWKTSIICNKCKIHNISFQC